MMKPILIFFYGDANTGKTNVLKKLGEWFHHRCTEYIELRDASKSTDLKLSIRYKEEACRVGIGTSGDNPEQVKANIDFFQNTRYFSRDEFCIFITAARYKSSDKSYRGMKQILSNFSCVDIPRNFSRVSRARKDGAVKLIREDDLFVYLQMVIQTRKRLDFSFI